MGDIKSRRGYVAVTEMFLYDDEIRTIFFGQMIPTYIEQNLITYKSWNVYGVCKHFRSLQEGEDIPQYNFAINLESGTVNIDEIVIN